MKINKTMTYKEAIKKMYSENWIDRNNAAWSFGTIGDNQAVKALIEILENDNEEIVRKRAIKELGKLKNSLAIESLVYAIHRGGESMQRYASVAIGEICNISTVAPILAMIGELKWALRRKTIDILNKISAENPTV